jgi:hypothetical protein
MTFFHPRKKISFFFLLRGSQGAKKLWKTPELLNNTSTRRGAQLLKEIGLTKTSLRTSAAKSIEDSGQATTHFGVARIAYN